MCSEKHEKDNLLRVTMWERRSLKYVVVSLIRTWRGLWWADEVSNGGSGRRWHVVEMVETRNQAWPDHTGPCRLYGCLLLVLPYPFATLSFVFCASGMLNCVMCHSGLICALSPSSVWPLGDPRSRSAGQEEKDRLLSIHPSYFSTISPWAGASFYRSPTSYRPSPYSYSFWVPVPDPNSSSADLVKSLCCFQSWSTLSPAGPPEGRLYPEQ